MDRIKIFILISLLLVLINHSACGAETTGKFFFKQGQIFFIASGKQEMRQLTNDSEQKFNPSLEPFTQRKIAYHGDIKRDESPSTVISILDTDSGTVIRQIPFNHAARSIEKIDWLSKDMIGITSWNRGRNNHYSILNITDGIIVSITAGTDFVISKDRLKIIFVEGIPGGYIPNPEDKTLEVMICDLTNLKDFKEFNVESPTRLNIIAEYSTREMIENNVEHSLEASFCWADDNKSVAFIDKHGDKRYLIVINIKSDEKQDIQKISLDPEVKEVKKIVWNTKENIFIFDQARKWEINISEKQLK